MPGRRFRIFSRAFKEAAVRRILAGEKIRAVADELRLRPQLLYTWRDWYEQGGADALVPRGRQPRELLPALAARRSRTGTDRAAGCAPAPGCRSPALRLPAPHRAAAAGRLGGEP